MNTKFQNLLILMLVSISYFAQSQSQIPIGTWKSYLPFNSGRMVEQNAEKIFYATQWSIMSVDKTDFSLEFLSTVEGMTEVGIQNIAYDQFNEQLIVAYDNSAIDIIKGDEIIPILAIRDNDNIQGDRNIYDIYIDNENFAYIGTGFGILQFDLQRLEFGFNTFTNFDVNSISRIDDKLIAATEDGAYYFDLSSSEIPDNFQKWISLDTLNGLPLFYDALDINVINDQVYLLTEDTLYNAGPDLNFTKIYENNDDDLQLIFVEPLQDGWMLGLLSDTAKSKMIYFNSDNNQTGENSECMSVLNDALQDEQGRIWLGDLFDEFRYLDEPLGACNRFRTNSPQSHTASDMAIKNDVLYVASGGVSDAFGYLFSRQGFYVLEDGNWNNINEFNTPFIADNTLLNNFVIEPHPRENKLFVGSFYEGLYEYNMDDGSYTLYDDQTGGTSLGNPTGDADRTRISGLIFDKDENLWIANHQADRPLSVLTNEGVWHSFDLGSDNRAAELAIDENGYVWTAIANTSGGVVVYDHNGTLADPLDDQIRRITSNSSVMTNNRVNCVEVDLNGDVWVGTAEGPVVFDCGSSVFDTERCPGNTITVTQDSIPGLLLITENIRTIAIDGANRKWFGTNNGVFVQSANGETQIFHFTEDNSPLFDNSINDLRYNPSSGEMFIATDKGIISYRTGSTGASAINHASEVFAFPDPVREDYNGPIAIKGLVIKADVKITDVNGKLVFKTQALGGQVIWDGKDYNGRNAVSGVYLVFSSSTDNFNDPSTFVTKIMIVR